jgi:hypothetical protein
MGPCEQTAHTLHVIIALSNGLCLLLGVWLAHRRKKADGERRWFNRQMRYRLGLNDGDLIGPSKGARHPDV